MLSPTVLHTLFEHSVDAVCVTDSAHSIIGWNPAAEKLTGHAAVAVAGQDPCDVLKHQAHGVRLCDTVCPSLQVYQLCEPTRSQDITISAVDGRLLQVDLLAVPVMSPDGGVEAVVEILRPVRTTQQMEALLGSITHELKTPLTAITGFVGLLKHPRFGELTPKQEEFVDHIRRSGEVLSLMVSNVALAETLDRGVDVNARMLSVAELLALVRDTFTPLATQKKVALELAVDPALSVLGDVNLLRQVLYNLVSNALNNTPHGHVRLSGQADATQVRVEVADTGVGIPESEQAGLVRKFSFLPGHKRGLGYGLFVADALVRAHGSRLTIESSPQTGTRIWFLLPAS